MAIPSKQIGWSQESNLIWEISRQLEQLIGVAANATGGGSSSYKVYTATITYTDTELISTNIIENTLGGSLTIELDNPGQSKFTVTSSGLFTLDKTFVLMNSPAPLVGTNCVIEDEDQLFIDFDAYGSTWSGTKVGFLEIRVYN